MGQWHVCDTAFADFPPVVAWPNPSPCKQACQPKISRQLPKTPITVYSTFTRQLCFFKSPSSSFSRSPSSQEHPPRDGFPFSASSRYPAVATHHQTSPASASGQVQSTVQELGNHWPGKGCRVHPDKVTRRCVIRQLSRRVSKSWMAHGLWQNRRDEP